MRAVCWPAGLLAGRIANNQVGLMTGKAAALDRVLASPSLCRRVGLLIWGSLGVGHRIESFLTHKIHRVLVELDVVRPNDMFNPTTNLVFPIAELVPTKKHVPSPRIRYDSSLPASPSQQHIFETCKQEIDQLINRSKTAVFTKASGKSCEWSFGLGITVIDQRLDGSRERSNSSVNQKEISSLSSLTAPHQSKEDGGTGNEGSEATHGLDGVGSASVDGHLGAGG
ncbi:hypothetical protein KCU93_g191, partial [Aureobasidium melanogenum]